MNIYYVKDEQDIDKMAQDERCFIVCNQEYFKVIKEQFNLFRAEEHRHGDQFDLIHFKRYVDHDVLSFSFFEWLNQGFQFEKVQLYISKQYVIFICNQNKALYESVMETIQTDQDTQPNGMPTLIFIYYKILDHILSNMFSSLEIFEKHMANIENGLLTKGTIHLFDDIVKVKNLSFEVKRHLRLLTYIGDDMVSDDNNLIAEANIKYFKNISTKMNRLYEFGTSLHTKSEHLMDTYNATVSGETNDFINKLTIVTVFATPITILSGIYGMNFVNMPELRFKYGYFILLALMIISGIGIFRYLKKSNML